MHVPAASHPGGNGGLGGGLGGGGGRGGNGGGGHDGRYMMPAKFNDCGSANNSGGAMLPQNALARKSLRSDATACHGH
jgi:hypothetical protein